MDQTNKRDDALFEALSKSRKKKKRKTARTVILVLLVLGVLLAAGVFFLRRQVAKRFASGGDEVVSAEASVGSISTQVSGSGTLLNVGEENLFVPAGVAGLVKLIYAEKGDDVAKCMYEHGALAVLSLDGKMALEIDAGKLASGGGGGFPGGSAGGGFPGGGDRPSGGGRG